MEKERREVASLTKIMTFYTCLKLIEKFSVPLNEPIEISPEASQV
jgi:D-alanyl-D-alanine carboxypeptidase